MSHSDPVLTLLPRHPLLITADDRAKAFWLIQKYTSVTYVRQLSWVFGQFIKGYEAFARNDPEVEWQRQTLKRFYDYSASLDDGLGHVSRGYPSGYDAICRGCHLEWYFDGRRFEETTVHEEIGRRRDGPSVGVYAWGEVAVRMARNVIRSLGENGPGWNFDPFGRESWAFPSIVDPKTRPSEGLHMEVFPGTLSPQPSPFGPLVATDKEIPTSGIWIPVEIVETDVKGAPSESRPLSMGWECPAYLRAGRLAPPSTYAHELRFYPAGYPYRCDYPASLVQSQLGYVYTYRKLLVRWQLLWEDNRYDGGREPGPQEAMFLDPSTQPPPGPRGTDS